MRALPALMAKYPAPRPAGESPDRAPDPFAAAAKGRSLAQISRVLSTALLCSFWLAAPPGFAQGAAGLLSGAGQGAQAMVPGIAYRQSLAALLADEAAAAQWYQQRDYQPLWTGPDQAARRGALLAALETAGDHGLPAARYNLAGLRRGFETVRTEGDLGRLEARMTLAYLDWAGDLSAGLLDPKTIDSTIVREISRPAPEALLAAMAGSDDAPSVLRALLPDSDIYARLMAERFRLEELVALNGWGPEVPGGALKPGDESLRAVALRDRLIAMGYLSPSATGSYDRSIAQAVTLFQRAHGLPADGVAGEETLAELNKSPQERLQQVLVAMERERWLDIERSGRMIWVNLPDFSAEIIDDGRVTFRTRAVIGREDMARRTPEFSDRMDHMVVNPSWGVPRSIVVGEYLPLLQRNPNALSHMQVIDSRGRVMSRGSVNFAGYTARSFPYGMRQPPGDTNALGKVKFMFPNTHNIYLHDTPSKSLFAHDRRAYSHGCIRLAEPFDFAHALFRSQSPEIEAEFQSMLKTGRETPVRLEHKVPIHLVYFTAYPEASGRMGYRRDVYGRDGKIWEALKGAGVVAGAVSQ